MLTHGILPPRGKILTDPCDCSGPGVTTAEPRAGVGIREGGFIGPPKACSDEISICKHVDVFHAFPSMSWTRGGI